MNIKNYTSSVSVERSQSIIETLLVKAGATHVAKFYENQKVAGFIFQMPVDGIGITFKLPSNPEAVYDLMRSSVKRPHKGTLAKIKEQAEKTSWKLLQEWVHIQISMIQMQQVEAAQVFLSYVYDGRTDRTLFQRMKESGFKQLTSGGRDT